MSIKCILQGQTQEMPEVDLSSKQDKLIGQQGQVVGFDTDGIATAICGWSNPNLLDNWYFADPINQRDKYMAKPGTPYFNESWEQLGTTDAYVPIDNFISSGGAYITIGGAKRLVAYPSELVVAGYTGAGYTIDRWYSNGAGGGNVQITSQGVAISGVGTGGISLGFAQLFEQDPSNGQTVTFPCWMLTGHYRQQQVFSPPMVPTLLMMAIYIGPLEKLVTTMG